MICHCPKRVNCLVSACNPVTVTVTVTVTVLLLGYQNIVKVPLTITEMPDLHQVHDAGNLYM